MLSASNCHSRLLTQATAGLHRTMVKVCKPDGEGTIAGARGNDEDAPQPAVHEALSGMPVI